jgi:diguanylate cyclase (GGDEF)-like protein/PAS domain S-box-containing protein
VARKNSKYEKSNTNSLFEMKATTESYQKIISLILALLGLYVIVGWLFLSKSMVSIVPGSVAMGFNTAALFLVTGFCLWPQVGGVSKFKLNGVLAWVLIMVPSIILLEHVFDANFGIDWRALHSLIKDGNPRPGRVAPNTCVAFIFCGIGLLSASHSRDQKSFAIGAKVLAAFTIFIGLLALLGYAFNLEGMYRLMRYNRMAAPTAVALVLVGIGLWLRTNQISWRRDITLLNPDRRITRVAAIVLTIVTVLTGLIGFGILTEGFEKSMSNAQLRAAKSYALTFSSTIDRQIEYANIIATRPALQSHLRRINAAPQDPVVLQLIDTVAKSFLVRGLSGIRFFNAKGEVLLTVGKIVRKNAVMAIPLQGPEKNAVLFWSDGFVLWIEKPIVQNGEVVGKFIAEQRMDALATMLQDARAGSASTDILLCGREGNNALCFPSRFYSANLRIPIHKDGDGRSSLAISSALRNEQGVLNVTDLRGALVLAAYTPVGDLGLGLVLKTDSVEFFKPIRKRLDLLGGLLLGIIVIGTLIMRSQVQPLARRLHRDQQRMRIILDSSHEAFVEMDQAGLVTDWNIEAENTFGWLRSEAIGRKLSKLIIPPVLAQTHARGLEKFLSTGEGPIIGKRIELPTIHRDGKEFTVEITISALKSADQYKFTAFLHDISERKESEAALLSEKEWLHVTLSSIGDGVITTDTNGNVTYLNPIAESMTGWRNDQAVGLPLATVFQIINEKTGEVAPNPVEQVLRSQKMAGLAENTTLLQRGGMQFPIEDSASPIRDRSGDILGVVLVFHDVTQARRMAAEMSFQATHDALTGLINRREFERRVELALQTGHSQHKEHTLLYLDLDQFKIVNDTCGHVAGDELLRQLTSVLQDKLRKSDTIARLGGDEFGVLLESCATEPAKVVAEQLRQTVADFHFVWLEKAFPIGVSIGLVTFGNGGFLLSDVLRMADVACYAAKEKGRNRIQVYLAEDEELARRSGEMGWVARIKKALDENRFVLYSQRIVSLSDGADDGAHYELLLRMIDENGAIVPPMAFIPAAERYGMMPALDRWVIEAAFSQYSTHHGPSASGICAINLSGKSISDDGFPAFVIEQLKRHNVPPSGICFEITETAAIANLSQASVLIRELKAIGCRFSLDDFGSGMSSFAYLKHLRVDYLKIDGGFVKDMIDDPIDYAMVASINNIGHVMGIRTIAEFVESEAIMVALRAIGVDFAQGYGVEHPKPAWNSALVGVSSGSEH